MLASRSIVLATAAAVGGLFVPSTARAHALSATVEVRADAVRVVVYFEDDLPAELAAVTVTDATGAEVASGTADARGVWAFAPPAPGEYRLTARSAGHVATVSFSVAPAPAAPAEYATARPNKALGLGIGAGGLLGLSALVWVFRRRR